MKPKTIHEQLDETRRRYVPPLRMLEHEPMRRAVELLEASERGDWPRLQWLFRTIERRWALLGALIARRRSAVGKLPWRVLPADDSDAARQQAERLRAFYEGLGNIEDIIAHLCMATFRGYAHCEIVPGNDGVPSAVVPVPQWHFARAGLDGPWRYLPDPDKIDAGIALEPGRWLVRECERPVDAVGLIGFIRYGLGRKDWDAWVETYGIPPLVIELPPDVPSDLVEAYQAQAEAIIGNLRGTMAHGAKVHNVGADVRQSQPFSEFLQSIERELVLAATGGLLTVLNEATGLGSGQSQIHQQAFEDLAKEEASDISRLLHHAIDKAVLGPHPLARFVIEAENQDDLAALADRVLKLSQAGFRADPEELSARFGLTLVAAGTAADAEPTALRASRGRTKKSELPDLRAWRTRFQHTLEAEMRKGLN